LLIIVYYGIIAPAIRLLPQGCCFLRWVKIALTQQNKLTAEIAETAENIVKWLNNYQLPVTNHQTKSAQSASKKFRVNSWLIFLHALVAA